MKTLFLFTISPVQSFIAQARKAQDLYAGSKLLSDLCRTAIRKTIELYPKADIRFPAIWDNEDSALPNRFLAEIEMEENQMSQLGQGVEESVRIEFISIARDIYRKNAKSVEMPDAYMRQLEEHLVIHWLFEKLEDKTYAEAYQNIESNLGAVKNVRLFNQLPASEAGRKDSLSGELNALVFNKRFKKPAFTENAIILDLPSTLLSAGEGLSAVGFTKRLYKYNEKGSFPSTAEIAQLDIKPEFEKSDAFKMLKSVFNRDFDYQLLYEENHTIEYYKKQNLSKRVKNPDEIKHQFFKKKNGFPPPNQKKYYAVLVFDGDDMGKWLSGELLGKARKDDQLLKGYHKYFSQLLGHFASKAQEYINNEEAYRGKTIFAGGDDFIALLNLNGIFEAIGHLRQLFDDSVNKKLKQNFGKHLIQSRDLSFSAGLCIAHYKSPLGEVLQRARNMESEAKKHDGKNALGIAVMKHSGELQKAVIKWGIGENVIANLTELKRLHDSLDENLFSTAFIENLQRTFELIGFDESSRKKVHILDDIFNEELRRFLNRATTKKETETKKQVDLIASFLIDFNSYHGLETTIDILQIVDFLYRKTKSHDNRN